MATLENRSGPVFIFDTNILIHHLDMFQKIYQKKCFQIFIPIAVVNELMGLGIDNPLALKALEVVNRCLGESSNKSSDLREAIFGLLTDTCQLVFDILENSTAEWDFSLHKVVLRELFESSGFPKRITVDDVIISISIQLKKMIKKDVKLISNDVDMTNKARKLGMNCHGVEILRSL